MLACDVYKNFELEQGGRDQNENEETISQFEPFRNNYI